MKRSSAVTRPRYRMDGGYLRRHGGSPNGPPYPVSPLIKDLILLELSERGGYYQAPNLKGQVGAVRQLLEEVLPGVDDAFVQTATSAVTNLEKHDMILRSFINPLTGRRRRAVVSLSLLCQPSEDELIQWRASRRRLVFDFT